MDSRRLVIFIIVSLGVMLLWDKYFAKNQVVNVANPTAISQSTNNLPSGNKIDNSVTSSLNNDAKMITVTTDLMQAQISPVGGDLRSVDLLGHSSSQDKVKDPYKLLLNEGGRTFIAQTGLVDNTGVLLPTHTSLFSTDKYNYVLLPNESSLTVSLTSNVGNILVTKTYLFKRDSYVVDVGYQITNNTTNSLSGVSAYWRLLRDEEAPIGETKFAHTFTGPAYYTDSSKFETVKFSNVDSDSYPSNSDNGWIGFIQHYFTAMWLLSPYGSKTVCSDGVSCRLNIKSVGNLASAGLLTDLPVVKPGITYSLAVPLFVGPEDYSILTKTAPHLELTKDYGWVYIFATPLFWLLVKIFEFVKNWGVAIILLTLMVKAVLYPLTRASYISMAKMKALAPKMEALKKLHADDKVKLQQAMMGLYKTEKVNPIGGCLPMILQIPVFLGLYWALLSSVELRQASFLWIHDLSSPDPFYILPVVLAISMFLQTFLNPPASDPVQAKMMRFMPLAFSVMFFFFPAGLVLYWLINNILSMAQQYYVNKHVTLKRKNR